MSNNIAKPFIKWAGGKTQLIDMIDEVIPPEFKDTGFTYIEPFVGGGAVLFHILNSYPHLEKVVVNDINTDLANTYKTIKTDAVALVDILKKWEVEYHNLEKEEDKKKEYYYEKRRIYNLRNSAQTTQSALFIFLNRTCFNGLYRVNRKNEFNVPIGSYKKPVICNQKNIISVNKLLQRVEILNADFEETLAFANKNSFFYFDPPYKPLSKTSNFNSYSKEEFDDNEQIRLAKFCDKIDTLGYKWVLSNSDTKVENQADSFFDKLYLKFHINRVTARRNINSNGSKRGVLNELLITNYRKTIN